MINFQMVLKKSFIHFLKFKTSVLFSLPISNHSEIFLKENSQNFTKCILQKHTFARCKTKNETSNLLNQKENNCDRRSLEFNLFFKRGKVQLNSKQVKTNKQQQ